MKGLASVLCTGAVVITLASCDDASDTNPENATTAGPPDAEDMRTNTAPVAAEAGEPCAERPSEPLAAQPEGAADATAVARAVEEYYVEKRPSLVSADDQAVLTEFDQWLVEPLLLEERGHMREHQAGVADAGCMFPVMQAVDVDEDSAKATVCMYSTPLRTTDETLWDEYALLLTLVRVETDSGWKLQEGERLGDCD